MGVVHYYLMLVLNDLSEQQEGQLTAGGATY